MSVEKRFKFLLDEIENAALRSKRNASDISLIAVSKGVSVTQILEAYHLGIRHFAESKLKDFLAKRDLLPKDIVWHFIGTVQSNKALAIVEAFSFIHSVTSLKTAETLSRAAIRLQKKCRCFIELNLSGESSKQGFFVDQFLDNRDALHLLTGLSIEGLMTMAPYTPEKEKIRACFESLSKIQKRFSENYSCLSMGMSSDFQIAIEEGSTHIRIGSLLFLDRFP